MTVQLIILGTRRPNSDDDYAAYATVAGPLMSAAGGTFTGRFGRIADLVGESGPQQVAIMEFPNEKGSTNRIREPRVPSRRPTTRQGFREAQHHLGRRAARRIMTPSRGLPRACA